jgi:cytosine permease
MASNLPDYVASAKPVPTNNRMAWYKSTAQTYAGIMLWFVFWASVPTNGASDAKGALLPGGILLQGLGVAILGVIVAAVICHFASYLAPGMMGMKTGLPLAVVGTSTYGVQGGFLMPGFFMGVLQFGWMAVNAYFSAELLAGFMGAAKDSSLHLAIGAVWAVVGAFVGLKGIQYVAKVATFLPLIPLVILLVLAGKTLSGVSGFKPEMVMTDAAPAAPAVLDILLLTVANIVGFFATAGAAGADIASSNRNAKDVRLGGLVGVAGATIFTGCLALLIVAGTYGAGLMEGKDVMVNPTKLMETIMGDKVAKIFWLLLAVAAFPPACFSSLIAANSMKNTLPKVNPFISVGIGTACSVALVLSGQAGKAAEMFGIIGASFGPICGAMTADYLLAGCKWPGPRAGFNAAGWISWAVGFVVGAIDMIAAKVPALAGCALHVPCPPVAAIVVGFVLYVVLAKIGLQSKTLEMPRSQSA